MSLIPHQHFIDKLAFLNGFISGIALYPQVWTVITTKATEGLSLVSFILIFMNSFVWLIYSIHRTLISLAIASILNITASGILIFYLFLV